MSTEAAFLSAVIAVLYDAALDPTLWTLALQRVCEFVQADQAMMFWQGTSVTDVGVVHHYNDDPVYTRLFLEKLAPLNPMYPAVLFHEVGAVHTFSDLVPLEEAREMTFYKEWVVPQDLVDALAVLLERDATRIAVLSLPCREGEVTAAARKRFALLVPHLQRAVAIGSLFAQREAQAATLAETLEHVGDAVFLLTVTGRVVSSNAGARTMIERGTLLQSGSDRLRAVAVEADRTLAAGLRAIEDDAATSRQGSTFTLAEAPQERLIAHLLPLADGARKASGLDHMARAALFVRRSRFADQTPLESLASLYRLTASEIRVVEATLRVSGLGAIADALGVSKATVKTHLNRIYRKCGLRNQSELIKRVAGMSRPEVPEGPTV